MKQKDEKTAVVVSPQVRKVAARPPASAVNGNNYAAAGALTLPFPEVISCCERNNAFAKRSVNHTRASPHSNTAYEFFTSTPRVRACIQLLMHAALTQFTMRESLYSLLPYSCSL
jgi:hypothetical protein